MSATKSLRLFVGRRWTDEFAIKRPFVVGVFTLELQGTLASGVHIVRCSFFAVVLSWCLARYHPRRLGGETTSVECRQAHHRALSERANHENVWASSQNSLQSVGIHGQPGMFGYRASVLFTVG
jgi:hypothetical protein